MRCKHGRPVGGVQGGGGAGFGGLPRPRGERGEGLRADRGGGAQRRKACRPAGSVRAWRPLLGLAHADARGPEIFRRAVPQFGGCPGTGDGAARRGGAGRKRLRRRRRERARRKDALQHAALFRPRRPALGYPPQVQADGVGEARVGRRRRQHAPRLRHCDRAARRADLRRARDGASRLHARGDGRAGTRRRLPRLRPRRYLAHRDPGALPRDRLQRLRRVQPVGGRPGNHRTARHRPAETRQRLERDHRGRERAPDRRAARRGRRGHRVRGDRLERGRAALLHPRGHRALLAEAIPRVFRRPRAEAADHRAPARQGAGRGVVRTTCRLCLVRCGMLVEAHDGAAPRVHVKGDRAHPLSRGYLCPKGKASVDMTLSPKRVLYPLRRDGARGAGRWRRVTWDEALDDIAARLKSIIAEHGARAVAVQSLPPKDYFAYDLFLDAIGSPTFFKHDSHQCFTPQLIADVLSYGNLLTYPAFTELNGTDVLVLWGINLAETNASKHQRVRDATRKGCRTIVVDPRPTQAAREAALWLRVRPGTDAALALGILNAMIANGWVDREFVAQWTLGFEALAARAAQYPPGRVAEIAWVPERDIVEAARLIGEARRPALYTFIGATMGGNSIATMRLMGFIPALAGHIDREGANGFLPPSGVRMPSYYGADPSLGQTRNLGEMLSADKFPLFAGPKAITAPYPHPRQVIDAMLTGKPYPVRALWTSCNPMVGLEDTYGTLRALQALDLLVVSELFETPTARLADYVLPITTHLESNAIAEYSGLNMISARVRSLAPRGEAREEGWAVIEVARRMGCGGRR